MVNKSLLPSEIETFYVIPTLRRYLTQYMKERGLKQKEIAEIFMVNTAAISQYNSKRGHKIDFQEDILQEIKKSAALIKNNYTYVQETQHLLRRIRSSSTLCQIHKQFSEVPMNCTLAEMGCHLWLF